MKIAGKTISDSVFNQYYNNKVDYDLAQAWQMDLEFSGSAKSRVAPDNVHERYSDLIIQHLTETGTPAALKNKYIWTIYNNNGVGTDLFRVDENNSYLDGLIKQTDSGLNSTINNYGCNYMSTIAFPQLLTGNVLNASEIQSIWTYSTTQNAYSWSDGEILPWITDNSTVKQPDLIANETFKRIGYSNINMLFGGTHSYDISGMKIRVPYNPHHFLMGNMYGNALYNPANTIGNHTREDTVYVYKKNN